jgi:hypothetical protein
VVVIEPFSNAFKFAVSARGARNDTRRPLKRTYDPQRPVTSVEALGFHLSSRVAGLTCDTWNPN